MNQQKVTPRDFFLWTGAMIALYWSVVSFIFLLFEYIDTLFPDPLDYHIDPYSGGIRFAMASLIVLVPVAIILMRFIRNDIAREPIKSEMWVRRWALVLTVFVAGVAVVGNLITLVNYFLGGDLTTRFILKVVVLFVVAGAVFFHFLADLKGYWNVHPNRAKITGLAAGAIVLITIVSGFFILGSPAEVRFMRLDAKKVSDLQNIQWQIVNYWQQKEQLPASLKEIENPLVGGIIPIDVQTGEPYIYEVTGPLSFKLCATFNSEGVGDPHMPRSIIEKSKTDIEEDGWQHPAGEHCYNRSIDPERHRPFSKPVR